MVVFTDSFARFALAVNRLRSCLPVFLSTCFRAAKSSFVRVNSASIRIHSFTFDVLQFFVLSVRPVYNCLPSFYVAILLCKLKGNEAYGC